MTTNKQLIEELKKLEEIIDNMSKNENEIKNDFNVLLLIMGVILCMLLVAFLV
ncbi:MAG: hypothetical protein IJ298_08835 [Ruminococcus sp.]|jgi:hypothetical protein|nr:hypothetical protein [Ruminococcus sp.]